MPEPIVLEHGRLEAVVVLDPFKLEIRRGGRRLISGLGLWAAAGEARRATLYGEPPPGRAGARLADGTRIRWREGEWSVTPERRVRFTTAAQPLAGP